MLYFGRLVGLRASAPKIQRVGHATDLQFRATADVRFGCQCLLSGRPNDIEFFRAR